MRILYIDIDCLRPDHLGCYGYPRATSPDIDSIAEHGVRFTDVHASDVPCLPSRTAFFSGRFGYQTGVVNHGGRRAEPYSEGANRGFASRLNRTSLMRCLRDQGVYTATVSSFAERHSAFHFCANFNEILNPGTRGLESGEAVTHLATQWLANNAQRPNWFLHVHYWDPHMPYRAPSKARARLESQPHPAWLAEDVWSAHRKNPGPHSASEVIGYDSQPPPDVNWRYPDQPLVVDGQDSVRALFDGYDAGVRHADAQVGILLAALERLGVKDSTAIAVSADHGESLGELNIYSDHQAADQMTTHVPFILRWPGVTDSAAGTCISGLHYHIDMAATLVELAGGNVPSNWSGQSLAPQLRATCRVPAGGHDAAPGRDYLVLSQAAWACQRGVRWNDGAARYLYLNTKHDAYHLWPREMLFELASDPHEQNECAAQNPQAVAHGRLCLASWQTEMHRAQSADPGDGTGDPHLEVMAEGGPKHVRGALPDYLKRLRATGREEAAQRLEARLDPVGG